MLWLFPHVHYLMDKKKKANIIELFYDPGKIMPSFIIRWLTEADARSCSYYVDNIPALLLPLPFLEMVKEIHIEIDGRVQGETHSQT